MPLDTPSWLQTNPQEWGRIAAEGARLDIERQQTVNQLAAEQARMAQAASENQMRLQAEQKQFDQQYQLKKQGLSVNAAYKNLQLQQGQQKLQEAAKVAANSFSARQQALKIAAQNAASKASEADSTAFRVNKPREMKVGDSVVEIPSAGGSATPIFNAPTKPLPPTKQTVTSNASGSQTNTTSYFPVGSPPQPQGVPPPSPAGGTENPVGEKAPEGAKEGQKFKNKATGKTGTVVNGMIVPDDQ